MTPLDLKMARADALCAAAPEIMNHPEDVEKVEENCGAVFVEMKDGTVYSISSIETEDAD